MEILTIETKSLGDRSYVIVDGERAAVVDPQRDIDRVLAELDERLPHPRRRARDPSAQRLRHRRVRTGADEPAPPTCSPPTTTSSSITGGAHDGDEIPVGERVVLRAVHTPGHTPHHLSYVVVDGGEQVAVFTGGSLLYGTVGRTDLISDDATEELTRAQYRSARRLAEELPGTASVHPTHGFGSFCSAASSSGSDSSTIAQEQPHQHRAHHRRRGPLRRGSAVGTHRLPPLLRPHGTPEPSGTRPRRPLRTRAGRPGRAASPHPRRRVGRRPPRPPGVRPVPPRRHHQRRDRRQLRHLPRLDRSAGAPRSPSSATPPRRSAKPNASSSASASTGRPAPPRAASTSGRPAGPPLLPQRHLRRARRRAPRRRAHRPRRPPPRRVGSTAISTVRSTSPSTSSRTASTRSPADQPVWVHCASGFRASIAASLVDRAGRQVIAIHDDWEQTAEARRTPGPHGRLDDRRGAAPGRYGRMTSRAVLASPLGFMIGVSLGALGGGGSILAVPVLVFVAGQAPGQATTTSLLVVGVAAVVGAVGHWRHGRVRVGSGLLFGLSASPARSLAPRCQPSPRRRHPSPRLRRPHPRRRLAHHRRLPELHPCRRDGRTTTGHVAWRRRRRAGPARCRPPAPQDRGGGARSSASSPASSASGVAS